MTVVSRKILKTFFQKGSKPSEDQFKALIDSFVHVVEDKNRLGLSEFDKASSYNKGASVIFKGNIYQAVTAISPGAFKDSDWSRLEESFLIPDKKEEAPNVSPSLKEDTNNGSLQWIGFKVQYSDFKSDATEETVGLKSLPPRLVLLGLIVRLSSSFVGPDISRFSISVGTKGEKNKFLHEFDVKQKVSARSFKEDQLFTLSSWDKETEIIVTARSAGANLNTAIGGELEVYFLTMPLK
jgi:hypothetical protein